MSDDPTARRPDIQGLRAMAVLLVAGNHAKVPFLDGGYVGVDVFFVISGFLITGLLLRDAAGPGGRVRFAEFYARRARRILPAATLVIVATCVAATTVLDRITARSVLTDARWAAVFLANVRFSTQGTDYFHQHAPSPLQHYWSLAVEEQFYLVWPVLIALTLLAVARWRGIRLRRALTVVLLALVLGSLALSATQTGTGAYFSSLGRAWELGFGGLLALALPVVVRVLGRWAAVVSWAGLAMIAAATVGFDSSTHFPGTAALLPVTGAVLLIGAGAVPSSYGAHAVLSLRPLRYVGDVSYSFYLWHWPVLVLGAAWAGHALRIRQNLLLVMLAFALAVLTYHLVENPMRRASWLTSRRSLRSLALWPTALVVVVVSVVVLRPAEPALAGPDPHAIRAPSGAFDSLTLTAQVRVSAEAAQAHRPVPERLSPSPEHIAGDFHEIGHCSGYHKLHNDVCQYGDPHGSRTLVLWGNSHATMWIPALAEIARERHWQFFPLVKEACAYGGFAGTNNPRCKIWAGWSREQVARLRPDVLVMGGDYGEDGWQAGFSRTLSLLAPLAPRIAVLQLAPGLDQAPTQCLFTRSTDLGTCAKTERTDEVLRDEELQRLAQAGGATWVPTRQWFCWRSLCPAVIGPRVPYADIGHITATYARHLVPALGEELGPLLDR